MSRFAALLVVLSVVWVGTACSGDASDDQPTVAATTSILGDLLTNVVGDDAEVITVMPPGADPHEFQPSARQAAELRDAEIVIANGLGFEEGLADVLDSVEQEGTPLYEVAPALDPIDGDPHVFTDPARMAEAVRLIADELGENVPALDTPAVRERARVYADELEQTDQIIADELAELPDDRRKLVTNHDVFAYFADRYDFEIIGVVIPGGSTGGEPSAAELAALADIVEEEEVPAIFADTSSPDDLADALADEVGAQVEVVELFSESLGDRGSGAETYVDMVRTNADRIVAALGDD
jgi:zinc/manganese transport system substrate-binding protein